jgi:predicted transcriptional regulator
VWGLCLSYDVDLEDWRWRLVALELGSSVGKEILALLQGKALSATEISKTLKVPLTTVLYHLSRLEFLGLVDTDIKFSGKESRWTKYYRASCSKITFKIGGE